MAHPPTTVTTVVEETAAAPKSTPMFFWEDASSSDKMGFTHDFALLLVILCVFTAIGATVSVALKKNALKYAISAFIQAIVMFFMWKHCRKWWEIILWHFIIGKIVGPAAPMPKTLRKPPA